jgi:hypothetical protein
MADDRNPGQDHGQDHGQDPGPPRAALIVLVLMALLVAVTIFVMRRINQASTMQDCIASGRTNCAPISAPPR